MRLLLVEDDPTLGPQVQSALQRAGYAVDLAADGIDADGKEWEVNIDAKTGETRKVSRDWF